VRSKKNFLIGLRQNLIGNIGVVSLKIRFFGTFGKYFGSNWGGNLGMILRGN
jgi:hypothetical protein